MTTDNPKTKVFQKATLLGDGADIAGMLVEYWGDFWIVTGKNHLGDWDVERHENRPTGRVKVSSSISAGILPETHPHFARLAATQALEELKSSPS